MAEVRGEAWKLNNFLISSMNLVFSFDQIPEPNRRTNLVNLRNFALELGRMVTYKVPSKLGSYLIFVPKSVY